MSLLIFPTQLFDLSLIKGYKNVIICEHPKYFCSFDFHPLKLLYHRASMTYYYQLLRKKKIKVEYIEFDDYHIKIKSFGINTGINFFEVGDKEIDSDLLSRGFTKLLTPYFHTISLHEKYAESHPELGEGKTNFNSFYIWCRKNIGLLTIGDTIEKRKPVGGKWTYDSQNREPFPKDITDTTLPKYNEKYTTIIKKSIQYVNLKFPHVKNYEPLTLDSLYLPINHEEAIIHMNQFLENRLTNFGKYEDAFNQDILIGYHSILSPIINIGLLTPSQVIESALKYEQYELNNIEGFIRQLFWREYVYLCYTKYDWNSLIKSPTAFVNQNKKLSDSWFHESKSTNISGFDFIDKIIIKNRKFAYNHHIERLMYLSNLMTISNISPHEMNRWFMINYIDAYEWVMIPNVYGMASHHVNLIMKRPYFSSSSYVSKMGRLKKTTTIELDGNIYKWCEVWDALYYNFINQNQEYLSHNYATASFVSNWKNKSKKSQEEIKRLANIYMSYYKNIN